MLYALLEPMLLFADEATWAIEADRDDFLERLLDTISTIANFPDAGVMWSDLLEAELWTAPNPPPWRADRDFRIALVPIVQRYLQQLQCTQTEHVQLVPATVEPRFRAPADKEGMIEEC